MSTPSVKLYQKASKVKADGTAPIYVRVVANRKSRLISTGVYVEPKHWNSDKGQVRASHRIAARLNQELQTTLHDVQSTAFGAATAVAVKVAMDGPGGSLTGYFETYIDRLRAQGDRSFWEVKKYSSTLNKLRAALGSKLAWPEVDRDGLSKFERHCRDECGNNANTTRKELTRLRRVYKEAIRDGVIQPSDDPFITYTKPKAQRVERRKLTLEEVEKLAELGASDGVPDGSPEAVTRDAFAFSFYTAGMRFGDVARLKATDIKAGRVVYRMLKTGTPMTVPAPKPAIEIAERYAGTAGARGGFLFPLLKEGDDLDGVRLRKRISSCNTMANSALKTLGSLAGIGADGLSFHVARHSFADFARRRSGNLYAVSKSLGHGNLATTEIYLKSFDVDAVDSLAQELWT